jgi:hypothetical protein
MIYKKVMLLLAVCLLIFQNTGHSQEPYRVGTTTASFLEIGIGGAGVAMGDAYVAQTSDMSSIYWNPAGLGLMEHNEAFFMYQPWVVDINTIFVGFALALPRIGTLGFAASGLGYGDIEVTNMEYQNGTGESYTAYDYAFCMSYARSIVDWFAFGATAKYVSSKIWHSNATALALDLGVIVRTPFFSPSGRQEDGMKIGMSISNYGTRMRYDGYDLLFPVDIDPAGEGNYQNLQGKYQMKQWELPLLFRVGFAINPLVFSNQRLTLAIDALHPNNNSEYVNVGGQYTFIAPGFGDLYLRGGYKALFMVESQYGPTFGGGLQFWVSPSRSVKIDYAYQTISILGSVHCTSVGVTF